MLQPRLKERTCRGCKERFMQIRLGQAVCTPKCAMDVARFKREKAEMQKRLDECKKTRAELEALKTIPELKNEAQKEFNRYIRARDKALAYDCICCAQQLDWTVRGGAVDAGHYRSTGSADHLRFNEDNCHAQRVVCNRWHSGRAVDYRLGLIARIGIERVEALEADHRYHKWTREELREIRDTYRRKAKEIEK